MYRKVRPVEAPKVPFCPDPKLVYVIQPTSSRGAVWMRANCIATMPCGLLVGNYEINLKMDHLRTCGLRLGVDYRVV